MSQKLRVLIADDHPRSRHGLRALLDTAPEIEVVGEAADGREAVQMVEAHRPDVVVLDARMPGMSGLEAAELVKKQWPGVRVILLTMYKSVLPEALAAGADAFLVKGCAVDKIWEAVLGPLGCTSQPALFH